jgi:hypothetical protein
VRAQGSGQHPAGSLFACVPQRWTHGETPVSLRHLSAGMVSARRVSVRVPCAYGHADKPCRHGGCMAGVPPVPQPRVAVLQPAMKACGHLIVTACHGAGKADQHRNCAYHAPPRIVLGRAHIRARLVHRS